MCINDGLVSPEPEAEEAAEAAEEVRVPAPVQVLLRVPEAAVFHLFFSVGSIHNQPK